MSKNLLPGQPITDLAEGDLVEKVTGDYEFRGTIVVVFQKLNGQVRLVVENEHGILHIFSPHNLTKL